MAVHYDLQRDRDRRHHTCSIGIVKKNGIMLVDFAQHVNTSRV